MQFRDSRLLLTQVPLRLMGSTEAESAVLKGSGAVIAALRGVFQLDPVPFFMRSYVAARNSDLVRNGNNISAAVANLRRADPDTFARLENLVRAIADDGVQRISVITTELGEVMLALQEGTKKSDLTPAREMSDGLLRFIAIATALLTSNRGLDIDEGLTEVPVAAKVLMVIEELENGLHPSQAGRVLQLIQETSKELSTNVLLTTHSPALPNAMTGRLNRNIFVCYREPKTRRSHISRITELLGYESAIASGRIGDVVSNGRMVHPEPESTDDDSFDELLGIS